MDSCWSIFRRYTRGEVGEAAEGPSAKRQKTHAAYADAERAGEVKNEKNHEKTFDETLEKAAALGNEEPVAPGKDEALALGNEKGVVLSGEEDHTVSNEEAVARGGEEVHVIGNEEAAAPRSEEAVAFGNEESAAFGNEETVAFWTRERRGTEAFASEDDDGVALALGVARAEDEYGLPSRGRFSHFSNRLGHRVRPQIAPHDDRTKCELITMEGGATTVAWALHSAEPELRIGLMLAANSGRPGGSCGTPTGVASIHPGHRTQEEDLMSNWMITEAGDDKESQDCLFAKTIAGQWGMLEIGTTGKRTIQGVDYTRAVDPSAYSDAWVVREASVSAKTSASSIFVCPRRGVQMVASFDLQRQAPCTLVFVAGPNAGCRGTPEGSMSRTLNVRASRTEEYEFFRESVAAGIRAGLDAMVNEGVEVALLAKLSCGIYGRPHRNRINAEFQEVVESVLQEELCGQRRGQYFKRVIVPLLP